MKLQTILDAETNRPVGIKVDTVEIKHVDLPQRMQQAMARPLTTGDSASGIRRGHGQRD
jgi:regulator of protease activity HflC (stomatin/prohibitin superfamily)